MNRLLVPSLALATAILFCTGCDPEGQQTRPADKRRPGGFTTPPPGHGPVEEVTTTEPEPAPQTPDAPPTTPPRGNAPAPAVGNPEYGKPVAGKPGFVTSPYAPYQGYVDVRGYAPGTEVKDPYTGRIFLVPAQ